MTESIQEPVSLTFPAEWAPQDAILLAWPHENTDWAGMLDEIRNCYIQIIDAITRSEKVLLLVPDEATAQYFRGHRQSGHITTAIGPTNDTWARDFGPLFVRKNDNWIALDFKFNGWGLKFASNHDNLITQRLFEAGLFNKSVTRENHLNFVLEGGSIESDGEGTLLTTAECLLSPNRNGGSSKTEIEDYLKTTLGVQRVLWLNHGSLAGDDTDSHIDTLARFCDAQTIAYVKCDDRQDVHFGELKKMEEELQQFRTIGGEPYQLIPLPLADAIFDNGRRLPASYANFLIINRAVLVPCYGSEKDRKTQIILQNIFTNREVIGIDCRPLIKQNGSLHCVTMQLPKGSLGRPETFIGKRPVCR